LARLGIITGLVREAACFDFLPETQRPRVLCEGIGPSRAADGARKLITEGCDALISFGIAGGLDPALNPATIILAEAVLAADASNRPTDGSWQKRLCRQLEATSTVSTGTLFGSDRIIETPADKRRLFEATGAVAVDMESHGIAAVAAEAGVPFLVVRLISDPATGSIPPAALKGVGLNGRERHLAVVGGLLRRPGDLPALLRLRRDSMRAVAGLRRVAALVSPRFGLE